MGLNTNYRLFIEGNSSAYHIPEYKSYYHPAVLSEEFMMQTLADFNQEIRESKNFLNDILGVEGITEAGMLSNISTKIMAAITRVKEAVIKVYHAIVEFFKRIIRAIKAKITGKKDKIEKEYNLTERINLLNRAISNAHDADKTVTISNLKASKELLNPDFPDTSVIGSDLVAMAIDTMNDYAYNVVQKDGTIGLLKDAEVQASRSFAAFIENEKNGMLRKVFGNYDYDINDIPNSVKNTCIDAFGSDKKADVKINSDLYLLACENIDNGKKIVSDMEKVESEVNKNFNHVTGCFKTINDSVTDLLAKATKADKYSVDMKSDYNESVKIIISRVNAILDTITSIVNASHSMLIYKANRIYDVYGPAGSSFTVKHTAHKLINNYIGTSSANEACNGLEMIGSSINEFDDFSTFCVMANEALIENEYNEGVIRMINEAEGDAAKPAEGNNNAAPVNDANNTTAQNTDTAKTDTNNTSTANDPKKKNLLQKIGGSILEWLKNLIEKFGQMIARFKNRYNEIVIKREGKSFWAKNKDGLKNLTLTDTKVNQWFQFNLEAFKTSTYIKMDMSSLSNPDFQSDEKFQEAILKKIYGGSTVPAAEEKETFTDRIKKAYQGTYINKEDGGDVPLSQTKYDHGKAWEFIDDMCTNGFDGESLGSVIKDYNNIKNDINAIQKNYTQYADKMKAASSTNAAQNADSTKSEPQNAAAIFDDSNFNVAEYFGLYNEATFNVGKADAAAAGTAMGDDNSEKTANKELDAMIKRCFNINTIAVTAKMTAAVAAYKQYMGLFKAVYKSKGAEPEAKKEKKEEPEKK